MLAATHAMVVIAATSIHVVVVAKDVRPATSPSNTQLIFLPTIATKQAPRGSKFGGACERSTGYTVIREVSLLDFLLGMNLARKQKFTVTSRHFCPLLTKMS